MKLVNTSFICPNGFEKEFLENIRTVGNCFFNSTLIMEQTKNLIGK